MYYLNYISQTIDFILLSEFLEAVSIFVFEVITMFIFSDNYSVQFLGNLCRSVGVCNRTFAVFHI